MTLPPALAKALDELGVRPKPAHAPVAWPKPKPTMTSNPVAQPGEF